VSRLVGQLVPLVHAAEQPALIVARDASDLDVLDRQQGEAVAERLMSEDMFTGWGVRTLSSGEQRYNPIVLTPRRNQPRGNV
jgi:hypothetical protein